MHTRVVSELEVAVAAHDLRNRLSVAGCELRQLRRGFGGDDADLARHIAALEASLAQTNALAKALLERACRQVALQSAANDADLVRVARQCIASSREVDSEQIELVVHREPLRGHWDAARLTHLLHSLITNALQYSPAQARVLVELDREGDEALLRVSDDGIGIPAADLRRIGEPFFRAKNVDSLAPGLGLGLSTARLIAEQYAGSFEVESDEGAGTTVSIRLPLPSSQRTPGAPRPTSQSALGCAGPGAEARAPRGRVLSLG